MDAKELYDVVKDVPKEAWPEGMRLHTAGWFVEIPHPTVPGAKAFEHSTHAELLFIGSMVKWLETNAPGEAFVISNETQDVDHLVGTYEQVADFETNDYEPHTGPSLLAALAAACKAVGGAE